MPTLYSFDLSQARYTLITSVYQFIFLFNSLPTCCQCSQHLYCILYIFTLSLLSFYLFFTELTCSCSSDIQSTLIHLLHLLVFNTLKTAYVFCSLKRQSHCYYIFTVQTHPTQSCFMSSIDVHTQYSYQVSYFKARSVFCYDTLQTDVLI